MKLIKWVPMCRHCTRHVKGPLLKNWWRRAATQQQSAAADRAVCRLCPPRYPALRRRGRRVVGPTLRDNAIVLAEIDSADELPLGLDLVVDFGVLTVIAVPLFMVLTWIQSWVGNWGIAIILLTVLLKAMFFPLQQASYKAMAKMKIIAPKMQQLKERYGDDRQRLQKAMMELYQKEKVNPMAGCLPILVQMPVFIALYWVILAAVELRHAPFYGWITDLSAIDPWYILPVLMGASMIIQTRLNPEPPDPVQAKVMKIMPVAFSVFFFFFPAGLVLYWLVNNVLSIAQQWHINNVLEQANQKLGTVKT